MTDFESKLKEKLNDEQFETVIHKDGPVVVLAGAGSGKTHTLVNKVANLIENWTSPQRILMITFTNAAADEMKSRVAQILKSNCCDDIVAGTYHKFCNSILRKYGKAIDMVGYTILSPSENKNLIDYVKSSNEQYRDLKGFPSNKTLMAIFSKSVNCQKTIEEVIYDNMDWYKFEEYIYDIETLFGEVTEYCKLVQKYNYDDLLVYMNELLTNDSICEKVATSFDYILVDEFQDTNNLQEEMLIKLSKYNNNIMVVGDISQSIYAFRGANVKNLQNFNQKFNGCKTIVLDTNYRSTQEILDFANSVMHNNVNSWTYYDMKANNKHGNKPIWIRPKDNFIQTQYVLQLLQSYHNKGIPFKEMAILERSSTSSFELEAELSKLGVPFEKRGGQKLMDYECIGDMLAYLTLMVKPHDLLSWFRVLKLHPFIGDATAKKIADCCKEDGFLINEKYKDKKYFGELDELDTYYTVFRNEKDMTTLFNEISRFYFEVRERAIKNSKMKEDTKKDCLTQLDKERIIVEQLKNISTKYDNINDFLDDLVLENVSKDMSDDKLVISTVHSAKGLEWKLVILIDCVDGAFPSYIEDEEEFGSEEDEEELRCFYVAITRAKEYLYLLSPKMKMKKGFFEMAHPTHYLSHSKKYLEERMCV